jgi:cytochrome bd-type quinol oxidase subunit 1
MSYPVSFEMDYVEKRSRLTTFFRLLLAIPHFFFAALYTIAFFVVLIVAWFALLVTARWPESLYDFAAGYLRYAGRLGGYLNLGVDAYPPFSGAEYDGYPVRVHIDPPLDHYSRLKVFFRPLYAIGAYIIRYAMAIVLEFVGLASWFVIVVTGRQPQSLQNAINFALTYTIRADALLFLVTEIYPPFGESAEPPMSPATPA